MGGNGEDELTLRALVELLRRRRVVILMTLLMTTALAALYCSVCTRRYQSVGVLQIQKESSDAMGLESIMSSASGASDGLDANINMQTQSNILQSDSLALSTIQALHMEGTKDFRSHWNPIGWVLGVVSPRGVSDSPGVPLENAPQRRRRALLTFQNNLKVKPVGGTRLIQIEYLNPDPKLAADVVNSLMKGLVDYTFQTRYAATNQTSDWLSGQLGELRQQSETLQAKVVELQRQSGVYSVGTTDLQGREQAYSTAMDQLQQATVALGQAEQNRILKEAIARAAETGNAEMLSGLAGNTLGSNPQTMSNSMALIQSLRQQEASQQAALQEAESKYGSSYPKLAELRGNIAGLERAIGQESARVRGRAKSDSAVASLTEANTRSQYEQAKEQASKLNDKAIEYTIVRQEANASRDLYEDLLKRLKEAGVLAGLHSSTITVVDPGRVPAIPKTPNVPLYMAISLGSGLFLGCLGAMLVDTLDSKVKSISETEDCVGVDILGATPLFHVMAYPKKDGGDSCSRFMILEEPQSTYTEALRAIRTSILLTGGGDRSRVILNTSSIPGEGKTVFSTNLAAVLAQSGRRVLLVDMDMRKGSVRTRLNLPVRPGLSELLAGQRQIPDIYQIHDLPELEVLQAGGVPPNPSELLGLKALQKWISVWREKYDVIVLDSPPLLPVTDASVVAPLADITLLLVRLGLTQRQQLQRSYKMLTQKSGHSVGVVLNGLRPSDENYYGYYGYRKYSYSYKGDNNAVLR
jgi:capsular exopolysaccharide synthesis family protein